MKRIILSSLCLTTLCLGAMAQIVSISIPTLVTQTGQGQANKYNNKLGAAAHLFLLEWENCKTNAYAVQSGAKAPTNATLVRLQDDYGLRLLPSAHSTAKSATNSFYVPVFVEFGSEEALQEAAKHGLIVQTKLKTIATALVLPDSLDVITKITDIKRIEVGTKVELNMDKARRATNVDNVHQGGVRYGQGQNYNLTSSPYKGEDVVVGVVDIGFDFTHPTFFDADDPSIYRVKRVWDQGGTASGALKSPTGYNYGVEYATQNQILSAQHCSETKESHGSHVGGIAGGSGAGTVYTGMAPKSDLVFVSIKSFQDVDILNGINYILNYAKQQNKPCVINLSINSFAGPHDGTSVFDRACDELKQDGFVLVGSAGNFGELPLYLGHTFTANTADTALMSFIDFGYNKPIALLDIWSNNSDDFTAGLQLINSKGQSEYYLYLSSNSNVSDVGYLILNRDTLCMVVCVAEHDSINQKAHIRFLIVATNWFILKSLGFYNNYKLNVYIRSNNTKKTMSTQMWLSNYATFSKGGFVDNRLKAGSTFFTVGETGGTGNSIISVGAYETRYWWTDINGQIQQDPETVHTPDNIASFSSHGPTADYRMKPDVAAPGCKIISAFNSFDANQLDQAKVQTVRKNGRNYHFGIMAGTSMASPAVAGIVALWLQANSSLNVDDVRHILKNTATPQLDPNNPYANLSWGYGKINASAGLAYILEPLTVSIDAPEDMTSTYANIPLHVIGMGHDFGFYYHTTTNVRAGQPESVSSGDPYAWHDINLYDLKPNQTYYCRAFGLQTKNGRTDTIWSPTISFKTPPAPAVITEDAKNITTSSATLYLSVVGNETSDYGFFYHTQNNVTNGRHASAIRSTDAIYLTNLQGLQPNQTYYYRAYGLRPSQTAEDEMDTVWGEIKSFQTLKKTDTTPTNPPTLTITTENPKNITASSATLYLSKSGGEADKLGFFYHTQTDVLKGRHVAAVHDMGTVYMANVSGLQADRYYYCKAYGIVGRDTVYGQLKTFKTLKPTANEEQTERGETLLVYPNPVSKEGEFVVELSFEPGTDGAISGATAYVLTITNLSGQVVQTMPMSQRQTIVRGLSSGVYLLQVESRKGGADAPKVYRAKVVVQ